MKWTTLVPLLLLPAAALAQPQEETPDETVIVDGPFPLPAGPSDNPAKPKMQPNLESYSLESADYVFPSGFRVILQEDHTEPVVSMTMWVDRGSAYDPVDKDGIAHYIEHLWFKSKHGEGVPMVWDILAEMGCQLNASTSQDYTNFMTSCSSDFTEIMLKLEAARLTDALEGVTEEEMLAEREVVRNELRLRYEVGGGMFLQYLFPSVYPEGHPYHRTTIGSHETLSNIELSDIQKFVDDYYKPEHSTLVIVGDIDIDEVRSQMFQTFPLALFHPDLTEDDLFFYPKPGLENPSKDDPDDWLAGLWSPDARGEEFLSFMEPKVNRVEGLAQTPPNPTQQENEFETAVEYPTVTVAWAVPAGFTDQDYSWNLTAGLLEQLVGYYFGKNDRNPGGDRRIRQDENGYPQVFCTRWDGTVNSTVFCYAELSDDKVDGTKVGWDIVDQVAGIYNQMDPVQVQMLDRQFSQARMSWMRDVLLEMDLVADIFSGRATQIAQWAHYTGSPTFHSDMITGLTNGSVHESQKLADQWLTRKRAVVTVLHPLPEDEIVTNSSESAWHGAQSESSMAKGSMIDPSAVTADYVKRQTRVPDLSEMKEEVLDNGMRIILLPHGEVPIVKVRLVFGGGFSSDADGRYTFARTFSETDYYSNPELDPLQFAGSLDFAGGGDTYTVVSVKASSGNLDSALWVLRNTVDSYEPDTGGKPTWIKDSKQDLYSGWTSKSPDWFTSHIRSEHWNPGHPVSLDLMPEDYDRMAEWGSGQVRETLNSIYQPANATLLIVGLMDVDEAIEQAKGYFDGWRANQGTAIGAIGELPPPNPPEKATVLLFDHAAKTQSQVTFRCQVGPVTKENALPMLVGGDILDTQAWQLLRERLGKTYGAGAGVTYFEGGSAYLGMSTSIQNDGAGQAVKAFQDLAAAIERGEIDAADMTDAILARGRARVLGQQSVDQMTSRLTTGVRWGMDWLTDYDELLAAVDAPSISAALAGCTDNAIVTVDGPVETVSPYLDEAGVEYTVYDWQAEGERLYEKYDPKGYKKWKKKKAKEDAKKAAEEATTDSEEPATKPAEEPEGGSGGEDPPVAGDGKGDDSTGDAEPTE